MLINVSETRGRKYEIKSTELRNIDISREADTEM